MTKPTLPRYAVLGSGAFGTALASLISRRYPTLLLGRDQALCEHICQYQENWRYLPGYRLPETLKASTDIITSLPLQDRLLLAVPAQKIRQILQPLQNFIKKDTIFIICAKGIEEKTGALMPEIIETLFPDNPVALLSGPSFAQDIAGYLPVAVTIGAKEIALAMQLCHELSCERFRCYASDDIKGVALGGALKNIFAIASGLCAGKNLGQSANAALITRSFAELRRIATHLGARSETLCGLSGFGDLFLTCSTPSSRNFSYGVAFAHGQTDFPFLAEGVATTKIAHKLCQIHNIDAPLIRTLYQTIERQISLEETIIALYKRPLKAED